MTKTLANIVCKRKVLNWPADKVGKYVLQSLPKWALLDTLGQQHAHWTYEVVLWKSKRALIFPPFIWYFLCKITTFLDVLVKTTHCSQRRFKGKQNHKRMWKKKKAIRREKNVSQDKTRVIPANATTELCHRLENIISRSTLWKDTPLYWVSYRGEKLCTQTNSIVCQHSR